MGAWGYGTLEDDTALDWIGSFSSSPSVAQVVETIESASSADFIDDYTGPHALAACEVLAAMNGKPNDKLKEEVKAWAANETAPKETCELAITVINNVYEDSELREIWDDSGENAVQQWKAALDDLISRLS